MTSARIFMYLQKGGDKLGYEAEALAIYDTMRYVKPPVGTVCVGSAYGEAALLLAAGEKVGAAWISFDLPALIKPPSGIALDAP